MKINGIEFKINKIEPNSRVDCFMGRCDSMNGTITINKDLPQDVADKTLIHECIHAILDMGGFDEESGNDSLVCCLENGLYSLGIRLI